MGLAGATFRSLRSSSYRWFAVGSLSSFAALQMQLLARGWLVYEMTSSPLALGVVTAAWGLPMVVFSLVGGALADRASKVRIITFTEAAMGLISLVVAVLIALGEIQLWHLVAAAFLGGVAFAVNVPARQALVPSLVGEPDLLNAYSVNLAGNNVMRVAAPAVAGLLVAFAGVAAVYFVTVGLYAVSTLSRNYIRPREREAEREAGSSILRELKDGLGYMRHHPTLPYLMGLSFAVTLLAMPYIYLLPLFATDVLASGARGLGWLTTAMGLGALAGSLWVASRRDFRRAGVLLLSLAIVFGVSLALFSLSRWLPLSLALMFGVGVGNIGYMAVNQTLIQVNATPEMRGRVASASMMFFGFTPLGVLPVSALAEVTGAPLAVGAGGVLVLLIALAAMAFVPSLRGLGQPGPGLMAEGVGEQPPFLGTPGRRT